MIFITRYCHIQHRSLVHQGEVSYKNAEGSLDDFLEGAFEFMETAYPKFYKMDRLSKLGFLASELLLRDVQLTRRYAAEQVALVLSNAHSSLDTDKRYYESAKTIASPALFVYTLPNIVAGEICIRQGIKGENAFFVCQAFDPVLLSEYVNLVMNSGKTEACVAGWVDVMDNDHDVFLYLAEKQKSKNGEEHTTEQLRRLYQLNYGAVNGRS